LIFQTSLKLEVGNRDVYLVIDLDTGVLGFTEKLGESYEEFTFRSAPSEFKLALVKCLEEISGPEHRTNSLINRKSELGLVLQSTMAELQAKLTKQ